MDITFVCGGVLHINILQKVYTISKISLQCITVYLKERGSVWVFKTHLGYFKIPLVNISTKVSDKSVMVTGPSF